MLSKKKNGDPFPFGEEFYKKYFCRMKKELNKVEEVKRSLKGWKLVTEQEDARVYSRNEADSKFNSFRSETKIKNSSMHEYYDCLFGATKRGNLKAIRKFVPNATEAHVIKCFEEDRFYLLKIGISAGSKLVSNREFVLSRLIDISPNRIVVISRSIHSSDNHLVPVLKGSTRANAIGMWVSIDKVGDDLYITNYSHVDPCGWIPSLVYNKVSAKTALSILRYKRHLEKKNKDKKVTKVKKVKKEELSSGMVNSGGYEIIFKRRDYLEFSK